VHYDYYDEDIPDAEIPEVVPDPGIPDSEPPPEPSVPASPSSVPSTDSEDVAAAHADSPSQSQSRLYPSPCRPARLWSAVVMVGSRQRYGWRPPVNVTQFMRLAGGMAHAVSISSFDAITDSFGTDWEAPSERAGGESRRVVGLLQQTA
jgi:hypothetical protein